MHMWMWFGYDLGEFMFAGLVINSRWAFALTWIVLFFVAMLFEASKLYLARVQRDAHKKLFPYRSDERRNLLCEREQGSLATTSRNASSGHVSRWASLRIRMLVNSHQSVVFVLHNVVGYLLMLAVMLYNVHLLLAVVFGMMLGYFLFGPKLTRLQMQCFSTKRVIICTPECDDTAETTPPLLDSPNNSESDLFICRTRTCIQPSHYFPATSAGGDTVNATCYYGAKQCPSRVARAKQLQAKHCPHQKEEPPSVEDAQLLAKQGCCKSKASDAAASSQADVNVAVDVHAPSRSHCCEEQEPQEAVREDSPQITCCHNSKSSSTESQEQIIKPS